MKLDLSTVPKDIKPNPIFDGLPESLKDPKCFDDIESQLKLLLISDHKHSTVKSYVKCKRCKDKFEKRQTLMKELGFKDVKQYAEWRRIMSIIKQKRNFQLR
jgi:hypothetical protein